MAPSTLGTFLRAFTFGHVRQLDRVLGQALRRAWQAGAGPGDGRLVIDVDSFVGEVHGHAQAGRRPTATRACSAITRCSPPGRTRGEVLHIRFRTGAANTQRGELRFVDELIARVARPAPAARSCCAPTPASATRDLRARCAARAAVLDRRRDAQARHGAIAQIAEDAWQPLADYPDTGVCEIAETTLGGERLIVRRVHLLAQDDQAELFTYWRHHAFITNRTEPMHDVDAEHREHAVRSSS